MQESLPQQPQQPQPPVQKQPQPTTNQPSFTPAPPVNRRVSYLFCWPFENYYSLGLPKM